MSDLASIKSDSRSTSGVISPASYLSPTISLVDASTGEFNKFGIRSSSPVDGDESPACPGERKASFPAGSAKKEENKDGHCAGGRRTQSATPPRRYTVRTNPWSGEEHKRRAQSAKPELDKKRDREEEVEDQGRIRLGAPSPSNYSFEERCVSKTASRQDEVPSPFVPLLSPPPPNPSSRKSSAGGASVTLSATRKHSYSAANTETTFVQQKRKSGQQSPLTINSAATVSMAGDDENSYVARHSENNYQSVCNAKCKFASCLSVFVAIVAVFITVLASSLHKINEGKVGIYLKYGALLDTSTDPGVHWMAPFVTEVREISIRPETDTLRTITTITKDGITSTFNGVQVK
jgi:hypothetical protein